MIGLVMRCAYVIEAKRANKINYIVLGHPAMQDVNTATKGFQHTCCGNNRERLPRPQSAHRPGKVFITPDKPMSCEATQSSDYTSI